MSHGYYGTSGNDYVWADGYSYVNTAAGNDYIYKSVGTGWVNGGSGTDTLSMYYADQRVIVYMDEGRATSSSGLDVSFTGIEKISGSTHSDTIRGGSSGDTLYGQAGNDFMDGRGGADRLFGGVDHDTLYGGEGDDRLYGGDGVDWLAGDRGVDNLYGGPGTDRFVFKTGDAGSVFHDKADVIGDFSAAEDDRIMIKSDLVFAGNTMAPNDGEYSVWQHGSDSVVSWRDGGWYNDVLVKGADIDDVADAIIAHDVFLF